MEDIRETVREKYAFAITNQNQGDVVEVAGVVVAP